MTTTLIIASDLKDLSEPELRSKFLQCANDVARLEQASKSALPLARASLDTIRRELVLRRLWAPRPGDRPGRVQKTEAAQLRHAAVQGFGTCLCLVSRPPRHRAVAALRRSAT